MALTEEALNDPVFKEVWSVALRILSRRAYTVFELRRKLYDRGLSGKEIYKVIQKLVALKLLDDKEFALNFSCDLLRRGYGKMRIQQTLYRKGLDKEHILLALDSLDETEEFEALETLLKNKLRSLRREQDKFKRQQKLFRHAAAKGHSYGLIAAGYEKLCSEDA